MTINLVVSSECFHVWIESEAPLPYLVGRMILILNTGWMTNPLKVTATCLLCC